MCRFNTGKDQEANAIVTSTGEFVVAWDFAKVKKGQLNKYEIKKYAVFFPTCVLILPYSPTPLRYEDTVVQDNFKFGDDKEIVSAPFVIICLPRNAHAPRAPRS